MEVEAVHEIVGAVTVLAEETFVELSTIDAFVAPLALTDDQCIDTVF